MGASRPSPPREVAVARSGIADALFSPVQQRVLGLLFGQPARRFQSAELIRLAAGGTGAVHRQLQRLAAAGLVRATRQGNQKHYQANPDSPIYPELCGLARKTYGLAGPLAEALAPLAGKIAVAFVFGSVAEGADRAASDVDLFIVSDAIGYPEVYEALAPAEAVLARSINPTVLTGADWRRRTATDGFAQRVSNRPKLFILGTEDDLV